MNVERKYLIDVIERYKREYRLSGSEAFDLFQKYGICDWIINVFISISHDPDDLREIHKLIEKKKKAEKKKL